MKFYNSIRGWLVLLLVVVSSTSLAWAGRPGWRRQEVDWRITGGGRITGIRHPEQEEPPLVHEQAIRQPRSVRKTILRSRADAREPSLGMLSVPTVTVNVIDSPPIDGFVPRIAVVVTDKRSQDDDWVAQTHTSVVGRHLTNSPETDFVIGLFDTGAGTHVISHAAANRTGIYDAGLLTPSFTELAGATNSVFAQVSYPLALFMDGLAAIDSDSMTVDESRMVGQSNISVVVGDEPSTDQPDLPTVIGSPMSVYFVTVIKNENPITITQDGNDLTSPDIRFYSHGDSDIPSYENTIPLNLIPAGGFNVQYTIDFDAIIDLTFQPGSPSIIYGLGSQSLFFVNSVDLQEGARSAIDKQRFMVDTGAQITVIGSGIGSRLGLDPANPDFEVDIQDITGEVTINPGFYIDSLEVPALGDWLSFTNVPVVLLDVGSPEGGFLDGIIGMNLFTNFNMVLQGGGLFGQDPPSLTYEFIRTPIVGDIAPEGGDGIVDFLDFAIFADAWLATPASGNWNPKADLAPPENPDGKINFRDLIVFTEDWLGAGAP
ncbi:MAG TPA: aspartyl protease family protein [Sedimentisphaerales bacterium]|nr:aspartyl protease family protein [Sedimentisphaerales bacterium]